MALRKRDEAAASLKASLVQRFGDASREVIDAEVEGRISASGGRLTRQDLDSIEQSVLLANKQRRGGARGARGGRLAHSRSAPSLSVPAPPRRTGTPMPPAASADAAVRPPPPAIRSPSAGSAKPKRPAVRQEPRTPVIINPPPGMKLPAEERLPKPPYGVSLMKDEDAASERSCVKVNPRFPVPKRPPLKAMDHWDLIVAFDGFKHHQEDEAYWKAGKVGQHARFKKRLDDQMVEINAIREEEAEALRQERRDMLAMVEENKRLKDAEDQHELDQRNEMKKITDEMVAGIERRRQQEAARRKREEEAMTAWLNSEKARKMAEDKAQAEEFARRCAKAKAERLAAQEEAARRKKAQEAEERSYIAEQQKGMDDKEAANRKAVQDRLDQIERNCATLGAEIAGRDAKAERELQEKIRRVQEKSDRDAKEDADRRKATHDRKTREMLNTLDDQCKKRRQEAEEARIDGEKQAQLFKEEYEAGLAKDRADDEARKQARAKQDQELIKQMSSQLAVHPRNFGITGNTQQKDVAYNRALFEIMHKEGFRTDHTAQILNYGKDVGEGKNDPFPSVGRFEGEIHPLELQEETVG